MYIDNSSNHQPLAVDRYRHMNDEKSCPLVLSEKISVSPRSYKLKLSTNLPGFLGFVTRHDVFASFLEALAFVIGFLSLAIGVACFFHSGFDADTMIFIGIGLTTPHYLVFCEKIRKKLSVKADAFVLDWLRNYLRENSIYFSEGSYFTSEIEPARCGFLGSTSELYELDAQNVFFRATNGVVLKVDIVHAYNNEISLTAMQKEELVSLLRDRKDLLVTFFPNDQIINTALSAGGE